MGLWDAITVLSVFIGLGFIVLSRLQKTNPKAIEWLKQFIPQGYINTNKEEIIDTKVERLYPENRSML